LVLAEQTGHLLVQFADLLVDQSQLLQGHLQQPPVHNIQLLTGTERVAQLFRRSAQALIRQSSQSGWVGFTLGERFQHPLGTEAEQIGDEAG
jgi:predicted DNA-binding transcriptional regulator